MLLVLTGCGGGGSGGGGGGGSVPPILISAVLSDASPGPGDLLTLSFSGDVTLASAVLFTDDDCELGAGESLGAVTLAPTLTHARAVSITLGTGAALTSGSTAISLSTLQDAILDANGNALRDTTQVVASTTDGDRPQISLFTANNVPNALNGSGSAGGTLLVPRNGFGIGASYSDASSTIDTTRVFLTADQVVTVGGVARAIGTNLAPLLSNTIGVNSAIWSFGSNDALPVATTILSLSVSDTGGNVSVPSTLALRAVDVNNGRIPFEDGQVWHIDLTRDLDTYSQTGTTLSITAPSTPNGTADFLEELLILGLRSSSPISNVSGSKDSNEVVMDLLQARLLLQLGLLYSGANVTFTFTSPGTFPSGQVVVPYASLDFSRIAVGSNALAKDGSASTTPSTSPLGLAVYDPNNTTQENNIGESSTSLGTARLGVMPMTLIQASINSSSSSTFRVTFDPFIRNRGTPIGDGGSDAAHLQAILSAAAPTAGRETSIRNALDRYARFLAVVLAHECGHSVGLVSDGAPPTGLFGGHPSFGGSSGHLDLGGTGIFPAGAQEVMNAAISFADAQSASTGFNPLIASYLQHTGLYDQTLTSVLRGETPEPEFRTSRLREAVRYDLALDEASFVGIGRIVRRGLRQVLRVEETLKGQARGSVQLLSLDRTGAHERVRVTGRPWLVFVIEGRNAALLVQHPGVQTELRSPAQRARLVEMLRHCAALKLAASGDLAKRIAVLADALRFVRVHGGELPAAASSLLAAISAQPALRAGLTASQGRSLAALAGDPDAAPALRKEALALASEVAPFDALTAIDTLFRGHDATGYARQCAAALTRIVPGQELGVLTGLLGSVGTTPQRDALLVAIDQLGNLESWWTLRRLEQTPQLGDRVRALGLQRR